MDYKVRLPVGPSATETTNVDFLQWLQASWFSSAAAADIMVSLIVVSSLKGTRTGWKVTSDGLWSLITYTISTGALTSAMAVVVIIMVSTS